MDCLKSERDISVKTLLSGEKKQHSVVTKGKDLKLFTVEYVSGYRFFLF